MARRFHNQVAWITGGATGIGLGISKALAAEGATVVLSGRRLDKLEGAVAEIEAMGGRAAAVACDVTDDASTVAAVAEIVARFGQLDVVVANAGYAVSGRINKLSTDDWMRQFDTNVFGVVRTVSAAMPELEKTGGRIGLVGSVAQYLPVPGSGAYAASKAALHAYGSTLSAELGRSSVSCTTIHPGFIASEIAQVDNRGVHDARRVDKRPAALMWTADAAARPMVNGLWRRRREVVVTGHGKFAAFIGRHLPGFTAFLMSRTDRQGRKT